MTAARIMPMQISTTGAVQGGSEGAAAARIFHSTTDAAAQPRAYSGMRAMDMTKARSRPKSSAWSAGGEIAAGGGV